MATAKDRVLGTAELLEAILLELDMTTLLQTQQVSKSFKLAIDTSINLQRALWFKPTPPELRQPDASRINPLFIKYAEKLRIRYIFCAVNVSIGVVCRGGWVTGKCNVVTMETKPSQGGSFKKMLPSQAGNGLENETWLYWERNLDDNSGYAFFRNDDGGEMFAHDDLNKIGEEYGSRYAVVSKQKEPMALAEMQEAPKNEELT